MQICKLTIVVISILFMFSFFPNVINCVFAADNQQPKKGFHLKEKYEARHEGNQEVKEQKKEYEAAKRERERAEKIEKPRAIDLVNPNTAADWATGTATGDNQRRAAEAREKEQRELRDYEAAKARDKQIHKENPYFKQDTR